MQAVLSIIDAYPLFLPIAMCLLGLLVGSFLNVVVHRLPIMLEREWQRFAEEADAAQQEAATAAGEPTATGVPTASQETAAPEVPAAPAETTASAKAFNLAVPGSHCPKCEHKLAAWENIPVISYLLLRRRCRACQTPISARYPLVEVAAAVLAIVVANEFGPTLSMLGLLVFTWALLTASLIDFDHKLIPDDISLPLMWMGLLLTAANMGVPSISLVDSVAGAAAGYLSLWCLYWVFLLATGKQGLGYGDFKLLAALGAWLGWQALLPVLLLASLGGSVVGIGLILIKGHSRSAAMPFGPFLASAGFIMLIWGPSLLQTYARLLGV